MTKEEEIEKLRSRIQEIEEEIRIENERKQEEEKGHTPGPAPAPEEDETETEDETEDETESEEENATSTEIPNNSGREDTQPEIQESETEGSGEQYSDPHKPIIIRSTPDSGRNDGGKKIRKIPAIFNYRSPFD
jgi:hypothetical protein